MLGVPPRRMPDGSMLISRQQLRLHQVTEIASVAFGVPVMYWGASRTELPPPLRAGLYLLATGALVVDTYLAVRFWRASRAPLPAA